MNLTFVAICLALAVTGYPVNATAQSADEVIERYLKAVGGKKAVEEIVTTELSGSVISADGQSGAFIQRSKRPFLFAVGVSWGTSRLRAGFNGRAAWQDDSGAGLRTLYGAAASRVRAEAAYVSTRLAMPEKLIHVVVTGRDRVRDRPVIVVAAVTTDGTRRLLYFDADRYLLVKDRQETDTGVEERFFDDYRSVDRVMEPHRIEWHRAGETLQITVDRVVRNTTFDDRVFDVPAGLDGPESGVDTLFAAAELSERRNDDRRSAYAYTQTSISGTPDDQGVVRLKEGSKYEVFHLGGRPVAKQLRKIGGEPLTEAEQRREEERISALVREYEKNPARPVAPRPPSRESSSSFVIINFPLIPSDWIPTFRGISNVTSVRRERLRGRPVIVAEFEPKRGVTPNGDRERQVSVMAGTVLFDEASGQMIQLESYLRDDVNRTVAGSSVRVEHALIDDDVWMPLRAEASYSLSFSFGRRSHGLSAVQFSDYKKFGVETTSTITLPDANR